MRGWSLAAGLAAVAGIAVTASLLGLRAQASAESLTGALVAAELRARPAPVSSPRNAAAAKPAPAPPVATSPVVERPLSFRQTSTYNGNVVFVPEGCGDRYDVLLHFHGAHPYVKDLAVRGSLRAVVAVFNAGNGAERYSQAFQPAATLSSLLKQVSAAAAPLCGAAARPGRVALSAWSAGYGAAEKLVARPEDRARVDAILLADGLHAAFTDVMRRTFAPNALQAFREFGALAKQGEKLFAISHSSIATDGYASTTECSRLLLEALDVPIEAPHVSGQAGSFHVLGSDGQDKAAHIAQFRQMDQNLLAKLRERWSQSETAAGLR